MLHSVTAFATSTTRRACIDAFHVSVVREGTPCCAPAGSVHQFVARVMCQHGQAEARYGRGAILAHPYV